MTLDPEDWVVIITALVVILTAIVTIVTGWTTLMLIVSILGFVIILAVVLTHPINWRR